MSPVTTPQDLAPLESFESEDSLLRRAGEEAPTALPMPRQSDLYSSNGALDLFPLECDLEERSGGDASGTKPAVTDEPPSSELTSQAATSPPFGLPSLDGVRVGRGPGPRIATVAALTTLLGLGISWHVMEPSPIDDIPVSPPLESESLENGLRLEMTPVPQSSPPVVEPEPRAVERMPPSQEPGRVLHDQEPPPGLAVDDSGVGADVVRHQLVGRSSRFPSDSNVVFWTLVVGGHAGTGITHVWSHDNHVVSVVELPVESSSWRTYSRLRRDANLQGTWSVEARDADGRVLVRQEFESVSPVQF